MSIPENTWYQDLSLIELLYEYMKNLKFELLKLLRNRLIIIVSVVLLTANMIAAYRLCDTENDAKTEYYAQGVAAVIKDAESRYGAEEDKDGFTARYYKMIVDKYSALVTDKEPEAVTGYGQYMSYIYVDLFLLSCCAFCAAFTFRREKETGEMQTLYAYKYGRRGYAAVKLTACAITTTVLVLLFCLSSFAGVFARGRFVDFTGGGARLQDLKAFIYAPNEISVLSAAFVSVLYKIPVCIALAFFAGGVSYLFNSGALSAAVSAMFMYGSYMLNNRSYINKNAFLRNCNLFAAIRPSNIFGELRCINVFGLAIPAYVVNIVLPLLLIIFFGAVFFALHLNRASVVIKLPKFKIKRKPKTRLAKTHGLYAYELLKMSKSMLCIAVLIITIAARIIVTVIDVRAFPYPERVYKQYCERWKEKYVAEIADEYREERIKIGEGYRAYSAMHSGGSVDDIEDPVAAADYYISNFEGFDKFREKYARLTEYAEAGVDIPITYEGGYKRFFESGADIFLILAIVFVCTYLATYDSVNNTESIMRTTKKGHKKLPLIKFGALITAAAALYAVFTLISFLSYKTVYGMDLPAAPVYAVLGFETCGTMPLGLYVALMIVLRFAGSVLLCLFCCGISSLIKNHITAMAATAWIYVIPMFLLKNAENKAVRCADPALLLDGSGFLQLSDTPYAVMISVALCVVIPVLIFIPYVYRQSGRVIKWSLK